MAKHLHLGVIAAGFIAGALAYPHLPGEYRGMTAFLLPLTAATTYAILQNLLRRTHQRDREAHAVRTYDAIALWILLFLVMLHGVVLDGLLNARALPARLTPVLLGLALIMIGNLLPRTRPNLVFGIRSARALNDRGVWMTINRQAGYVAVALGAVMFLSGALLPPGKLVMQIVSVATLVAAGVFGLLWRRHGRA